MSYGYRQYRDTAHRWTQIGVGLISVIAGLILIVCVTAPMYVSSMLKDAVSCYIAPFYGYCF